MALDLVFNQHSVLNVVYTPIQLKTETNSF